MRTSGVLRRYNMQILDKSALGKLTAGSLLFMALAATAGPDPKGAYTKEQAQAGANVYSANCASCHGSHLQGGAAPALKGPTFAKSAEVSFSTASKLLEFISSQMPVNNPGSLTPTQYRQVLSFILAGNQYPAAKTSSEALPLDELMLLPHPNQEPATSSDSNLEIQN